MMDVREKLVELLEPHMSGLACEYESGSCELTSCRSCNAKNIADHLIANGVTVQKWISADDRLPEIPEGLAESPEPVLYMMKNTKTIYVGYYGEGGVWRDKYFRQYSDSRNGVDSDDVTCWMYQCDLLKPPKEE